MRVLITADLQLTDNPRDSYRFQFFETLHDLIQSEDVERLLILGDLTEEKDRHGAWLANEIPWQLHRLVVNLGCTITILRGNHDAIDPENPFFGWLNYINGITWINQPSYSTIGGSNWLFLPHTPDYQKDWEDLTGVDYIFVHNTFAGVQLANGFKLEGIPVSALPRAKRVIAGDIHIPQKVGPVTYVGAPYRVDFGDEYDGRVLLLDTETDKLMSILVGGPQKRLLKVSSMQELARQHVNAGDVIKVEVKLKPTQAARWSEIAATVRNWGDKQKVNLFTVAPILEGTTGKTTIERKPHRSDEQLLEDYATSRNIDEHTLETGLDLLETRDATDP